MADILNDAERRMDRAARLGAVDGEPVGWSHILFRELPSLACNDAGPLRGPSTVSGHRRLLSGASRPPPRPTASLVAAVVIRREPLAQALVGVEGEQPKVECERTEELGVALDLACALAPNVAVVDAKLSGAFEFAGSLSSDALNDPTPVVVLGTSPGLGRAAAASTAPPRLGSAAEPPPTATAHAPTRSGNEPNVLNTPTKSKPGARRPSRPGGGRASPPRTTGLRPCATTRGAIARVSARRDVRQRRPTNLWRT
jgi:hypothetical protein